jgi:hypothetical protein
MFLLQNGKPVQNYVKEDCDSSLLLVLDLEYVIMKVHQPLLKLKGAHENLDSAVFWKI